MKNVLISSILLLSIHFGFAQQIMINEVMTSNSTVICDEDNDFSDWIELYNSTNQTLNLNGYGLSDEISDPFKWEFDDYYLEPGEYLLIWASDKNLQAGPLFPDAIPGLMAWFNSTDIDTTDINQVWNSGGEIFVKNWICHNGQYHAQQSDVNKYPLYLKSDLGVYPALRFDGVNDMLTSNLTPPIGNEPRTIIIMIANANMETGNTLTNNHLLHYGSYQETYGLTCQKKEFGGLIGNSYWFSTFYGIAVMDEQPKMISQVFAANCDNYYVNGSFAGTNFVSLNTGNQFTMRIASRIGDGNEYFAGDIAEIIVYDTSLSVDERRRVENYLALKYDMQFHTFHSNFKLSSAGESVMLTRPDGSIEDQITIPALSVDYSYGKYQNGYSYFTVPTPGGVNNTIGYSEILEPPTFSHDAGFYSDTVDLSFDCPDPDAWVVFTLDGSEPDLNNFPGFTFPVKYDYSICNAGELTNRESYSFVFENSLFLTTKYDIPNDRSLIPSSYLAWNPPTLNTNKANIVKAACFKDGAIQSKTITKTYFVDTAAFSRYELPVISLVMSDYNLFNYDTGIYVPGLHYDMTCNNPVPEPNYRQDTWERPIHFELFDNQGNLLYNHNAGGRIHGSYSSNWSRKSFRIEARDEYGDEGIFEYPLFPGLKQNPHVGNSEIVLFNSFLIRNSGHNWWNNLFHDAFIHHLVRHLDCDPQESRAVVHFLNGEYWGIMNLREKHDEYYFAEHYNMDPDDVIIANGRTATISSGYQYEYKHYSNVENFVNNNSLSNPENYNYVNTQIDVENYLMHFLIEIYINNSDFLGNNRKFWRKRTSQYFPNAPFGHDGRWRWILYDTDISFTDPEFDRLTPTTTGTGSPTLFLRKLLENQDFENMLVNSFCDQMNSSFLPAVIVQVIDSMRMNMDHDIYEHIDRWNNIDPDQNCPELIAFANARPYYMRQHLKNRFNLADSCIITVDCEFDKGMVIINSLTIDNNTLGLQNPLVPYPWDGVYFKNIPIRLIGKPKQGFVFSHWNTGDLNDTIFVIPRDNATFIAYFSQGLISNDSLIINEINYNSAPDFDSGDWVEFYNPQDYDVNISNWYFKDEDDEHTFVFPLNTYVAANGYLVLCEDVVRFSTLFPEIGDYIGEMDFGFSGSGELLRLFNQNDQLVDTVHYDDNSPWPDEPDGDGPTLELITPEYDNSLPTSWMASSNHGTPGKMNSLLSDADSDEVFNRLYVKIIPNPFNFTTQIIVKTSNQNKSYSIDLWDMHGNLIKKINQINDPIFNFSRENLISGIYLVNVKLDNEYSVWSKLIIF